MKGHGPTCGASYPIMRSVSALLVVVLGCSLNAAAASRLSIAKLDGSVVLDGDLSDSGWASALRVDEFVEYAKTDNTAPPVRTVAYVTYDERYLLIAFRCDDPRPAAIRAPF